MRTLIVVSDKLGDGENGTLILHSESYSRGAALVLAERYRVMDVKGRTTEGDIRYELDELVNAAGAYLFGPGPTASEDGTPYCWPFSPEHWHGGQDRIADLVRAGQFITAEIDRLLELADKGRNPVHPEISSAGGPMKKAGSRLAGFRSDGDRLEANADTLSSTARVFAPGTGSDPATWFDQSDASEALSCCCATNEPGTRCYRCKEGLHETCSDSGANPRPRCHEISAMPPRTPCTLPQGHKEPHDWPVYSETAGEAGANPRLRHDGRRILRCDKSRELGHEEHNWRSSFLPRWCPGYVRYVAPRPNTPGTST